MPSEDSGQTAKMRRLIRIFAESTSFLTITDFFFLRVCFITFIAAALKSNPIRGLFVCVVVLRPSEPNGVMSSAVR